MRKIDTDVLVIEAVQLVQGVRPASASGTVLVDKRDLSHGTTGRYHGLLHSGGRYVVKDPLAAIECIRENQVLRKIMPHCLEDTGGFFVLTPVDDLAYAPKFMDGCHKAGIAVEEISITRMLKEEPLLNPGILRCFRVPDAAADSFLATEVNAESARQYGAQIFNYHELQRVLREGNRIVGAQCLDVVRDEQIIIFADMVVNAAGAWAGIVAGTAGIPIEILPGKGTMVAVNHRIVNTVINRCSCHPTAISCQSTPSPLLGLPTSASLIQTGSPSNPGRSA
jgi:glycerol-3-phosphate dehydrogenase